MDGQVLHTYFFPLGCARCSACGVGSGPSSQEALFDLGVGVLAVFLLSCIGYPSQSGFKPKSGRSQAWDALHYANGNGKSPRYEAQKEFSRVFRDAPGIVLSDIDPPYLNALLPKPFVAAPIDDHHNYCYSRLWHYGKAEAIRLVQSGLDHATPVYALLLPSIMMIRTFSACRRSRVIVGNGARNPIQEL